MSCCVICHNMVYTFQIPCHKSKKWFVVVVVVSDAVIRSGVYLLTTCALISLAQLSCCLGQAETIGHL